MIVVFCAICSLCYIQSPGAGTMFNQVVHDYVANEQRKKFSFSADEINEM